MRYAPFCASACQTGGNGALNDSLLSLATVEQTGALDNKKTSPARQRAMGGLAADRWVHNDHRAGDVVGQVTTREGGQCDDVFGLTEPPAGGSWRQRARCGRR
jgi:hypothetical protein